MMSDVARFADLHALSGSAPAPTQVRLPRSRKPLFSQIGCALCHTPSMQTGQSSVAALTNIQANLYSDLLIHHMGPGLADGIGQGAAGPRRVPHSAVVGIGPANLLPA